MSVHISNISKENLQGFIANEDGEDSRKILLENGFAKLAKDAMNGLSTK